MTIMNEARLLAIIAAHGATSERWPDDEREAALALLETSAAARRALTDAAGLDGLLGRSSAPPVSLSLQSKVASIPEQHSPGVFEIALLFWPFGAIWRPASGLVAAAIIGLVVGIGTPPEDIPVSATGTESYAAVIAAAGGDIEENLE
jgi:hypothetical protein